jgi:hypothetical protein
MWDNNVGNFGLQIAGSGPGGGWDGAGTLGGDQVCIVGDFIDLVLEYFVGVFSCRGIREVVLGSLVNIVPETSSSFSPNSFV